MERKIITFFLASSINDLEYDRLAVGDFVTQLNNIYESSGICIKLYKCDSDTLDHSIRINGSQVALDEIIKQSDICFVIFWHKAGEFTLHELNIALEASRQNDKPKVVVYFKNIPEGDCQPDEIKKVMHIIDEELLHYHREYAHIDSLKLGIITQLQVHGFINADISVKDNQLMCDNNQIMSVDRIPLFADNTEYTDLLKDYTEAVRCCVELQAQYEADNTNLRVYCALGKAVKKRDRLKADMEELTEHILDIGNSIAAMTNNGKAISDKIRKAIKCFDSGDYEGVLEVLNPDDIEKNVAELDEIERNLINERIAVVEEYRLRILALKAQARWEEVRENYAKAVEQVRNRPQMPKTIMYEYASFLLQQTDYKECIEICTALDGQFGVGGCTDQRLKGKIDNLCGLAYYKIGSYQKAHERLLSSMQIRKKLFEEDSSLKLEYAESCTNLARIYYYLDRHGEADELYRQAISAYGKAEDSDDVCIKIADVQMSLADLYYQTNKHREAEELSAKALEVCKRLAETQPSYLEYVANIGSRLAHLNRAVLSHRFSDKYYVGSLKLRSRLLPYGKKAFSALLKTICRILSEEFGVQGYETYAKTLQHCGTSIDSSANLKNEIAETDFLYYDKTIDCRKIEDWCLQALNIRRELARNNPEAYESSVAESCKNLAETYLLSGEYDKAEMYLEESLEIQNRLMSFKGESKNGALAATNCAFAELYAETNQFENAEKAYLSALYIYRSLSFTNELARTYNHLGRLYCKFAKKDEALNCYFNSIVLYISLYRKSPGAYIDRIVNVCANALYSLCPQKEKQISADLLATDPLSL